MCVSRPKCYLNAKVDAGAKIRWLVRYQPDVLLFFINREKRKKKEALILAGIIHLVGCL
jgi:hypothetical protein